MIYHRVVYVGDRRALSDVDMRVHVIHLIGEIPIEILGQPGKRAGTNSDLVVATPVICAATVAGKDASNAIPSSAPT